MIHFTQQGNQLITVIHLLCPLQESDVLLCCEGTTTVTKRVSKMLLLPTPYNSCFLPMCALRAWERNQRFTAIPALSVASAGEIPE